MFTNIDVFGIIKNVKTCTKRSRGPKTNFFWRWWDISGHIGTYWAIFGMFWDFLYQRVFWAPEGILCDGYSRVGLHTDLSTKRSQVRIPPSAGRPTEINHNKSERKVQKVRENHEKGPKRSKKIEKGPTAPKLISPQTLKIDIGAAGPSLTFLDVFHGFISFIHWFMIDLSDLLWLISPRPPAGGGIRTCDLVVERSVCNPTGLYPSLPPSGTQNALWPI